jgi:hypothetical protein
MVQNAREWADNAQGPCPCTPPKAAVSHPRPARPLPAVSVVHGIRVHCAWGLCAWWRSLEERPGPPPARRPAAFNARIKTAHERIRSSATRQQLHHLNHACKALLVAARPAAATLRKPCPITLGSASAAPCTWARPSPRPRGRASFPGAPLCQTRARAHRRKRRCCTLSPRGRKTSWGCPCRRIPCGRGLSSSTHRPARARVVQQRGAATSLGANMGKTLGGTADEGCGARKRRASHMGGGALGCLAVGTQRVCGTQGGLAMLRLGHHHDNRACDNHPV